MTQNVMHGGQAGETSGGTGEGDSGGRQVRGGQMEGGGR